LILEFPAALKARADHLAHKEFQDQLDRLAMPARQGLKVQPDHRARLVQRGQKAIKAQPDQVARKEYLARKELKAIQAKRVTVEAYSSGATPPTLTFRLSTASQCESGTTP
jgi:hypothetical protein